MRIAALIVALASGLVASAGWSQDRYFEVEVREPFVELHTGPGRGYPVFYIAERGETVAVVRRRTDWFQIEVARGERGWVHLDQMTLTFNPDGGEFEVPGFSIEDYTARRWEVGVQYGDFGGADAVATYGAVGLSQNLQLELWITQALGQFSNSDLMTVNITHLMFPDRRATPFLTLGAGTITTRPKATLVETIDRNDSVVHAGIGVRTYLTRRFVFRAEYKSYVVLTSRDDNEEVREWKAGFSFFF